MPPPSAVPSASPEITPGPSASAEPSPTPEPTPALGLTVDHVWFDTIDERGRLTTTGSLDEALVDAERFTVYRVRFQIVNAGDTSVAISPRLEALDGGSTWTAIPEIDPIDGEPFYAASDAGRTYEVRETEIGASDLRLDAAADPSLVPVAGTSSAGQNPASRLELPGRTFTEVEFAIRATVDAAWLRSYGLRLTNGGDAIESSIDTSITMGARPKVKLSPGSQSGEPVDDPEPLFKLDLSGVDTASNRFALTATNAGLVTPFAAPSTFVSPHTNYTLTTDACAACHSTHTAQGAGAPDRPRRSPTCASRATTAPVPSRTWRRSGPTRLLPRTTRRPRRGTRTRRSRTTDHIVRIARTSSAARSTGTPSAPTATSRTSRTRPSRSAPTTAGRQPARSRAPQASRSTNGAGGIDTDLHARGRPPTFEYQLCFKCHSGFTELPATGSGPPEPLGARQGRSSSTRRTSPTTRSRRRARTRRAPMALSLSGDVPVQAVAVRHRSPRSAALNCHGDTEPRLDQAARQPDATPRQPRRVRTAASSCASYRDRDAQGRRYDCYDPDRLPPVLPVPCRGADGRRAAATARYDTNFSIARLPPPAIIWATGTGGVDIDMAGAGQGNAICAECHFRTHGTALAGERPDAAGRPRELRARTCSPYDGTNVSSSATSSLVRATGATRDRAR